MNAVEIEQAVSDLVNQPFDPAEFPFAFLEAFGNKQTTIKKLRAGATNKSDLGGLLQTGNIHIKTTGSGLVTETSTALRLSPATRSKRHRVKFILATDGTEFEAEDLNSGETVACTYHDFPDYFGFFLPLAGITTVKQIRENAFDVRATSRLNRLYVTLLQENADWSVEERRRDMNHFMARLIFCFFAEDTGIFNDENLFTATIAQMSERDDTNTHDIIQKIFQAMDVPTQDRRLANLPRWADAFPYVNGELFSTRAEVPRFSRIAKKYLLHIGNLDWRQINPDIFGSMIQAVADDNERSVLGMHYTSVPNILKVLNPLFLDELRQKLDEAEDNPRKLLNLRKRMSKIRIFDPACGSGNFLVIAYKEIRSIEADINRRLGELQRKSDILLTNFRGIEIRDFSAEIARLALIIAEYQADVIHVGQNEAKHAFLPLDAQNWITCGNALRLDWLSLCPPTGRRVRLQSDDLFGVSSDQVEVDFENAGGETYICGNPPYMGSKRQTAAQKAELADIFGGRVPRWKSLDYVTGWFMKAVDYADQTHASSAFVATKSIVQGQQVPIFWNMVYRKGHYINFAHTSFRWSNLATHNASVIVVIVGVTNQPKSGRTIYSVDDSGQEIASKVSNINPYLIPGSDVLVRPSSVSISKLPEMARGNSPTDDGNLLLEHAELCGLELEPSKLKFIRKFVGSRELIAGTSRLCIWVEDSDADEARSIPAINERIESVRYFRLRSKRMATRKAAEWPHRFDERKSLPVNPMICIPIISSENRPYLPVDLLPAGTVISNKTFGMQADEIWPLAVICSRLNLVWVATVCARMGTSFSYTNTLGWNTFPVPALTEKNRADLSRCAVHILLARESHFPATIADLYDLDRMPENLRAAHDRNDETLERIYIGRRFKNDSERLEKLFEMYAKMTSSISNQ